MTLDSHEIRLGNTYKIELGDGTYKTDLINFADLENLLDDDLDDFYQAMELGEEWLLKFGFEFSIDTWYLKGFALWETEWGDEKGNEGIGLFYELREHGMMNRHIKYVHQLENLYFALTGEELIYKF